MTTVLLQNFESLKKLVLTVADLSNITPADCKILSAKIFKKTSQQVSETTLKRVYGFAYSKFNPSLFTLDAMAKFCNFTSWTDFCDKNIKPAASATKDVNWENIKRNADKITGFTLQVLKNKSGIPYNLTIKRKFIGEHLELFAKDGHEATLLTAPAGYGKTIALCHWVEERLAKTNDIILFFSSNALINVFLSGKDINEWLLSLLGYDSGNDFATLMDGNKHHDENFYLVIDGLDEHMFKKDQFQVLLNQVLDVFSFHKDHPNFKLILTMRPSTWINNRHEFENTYDDWFYGIWNNDEAFANVPLLTPAEIKEIAVKINPAAEYDIGADIMENFSYPIYVQYFYKAHRDNFSFDKADHLSMYELVTHFILNKIYLGNYSAEKAILNQSIIENMDFANEKFEVSKLVVNDLIIKHNVAYNELVGVGFLKEINNSGSLQYNTTIQIGNNNFLNYAIARLLLARNNNVFDGEVVKALNEQFPNSRKVQLLKWCIIFAIKNDQQKNFKYIADTGLTAKEKSELIIFMGDMLKRETSLLKGTDTMAGYFNDDHNDNLFNYFFGLEYINPGYKITLQTLLQFEISNQRKALVHTSLAVIAIIQLDINQLEEHLTKLKDFSPDELQLFVINPVSCIETIFYYLKYGIVKKEAFIELTKFYFNPPTAVAASINNGTNDILYLLATYTLSICSNSHKMIRFIKALKKLYKKEHCVKSGFVFLLKLLRAEANFALNRHDEVLNIYNELLGMYRSEKDSYTPFMIASFYLLKAKMSLQNDKSQLHESINRLFELADKSGFKLLKAQALAFIIKNKGVLDDEHYFKDLHQIFTRTIQESKFRQESFIDNATVLNAE